MARTGTEASSRDCTVSRPLSIIATLLVITLPLNFVWELAQMPLYEEQGDWLAFAVHCIIPSLGDGVIVLMIFGVGWLALRRMDWFARPGLTGYGLMLVTGFLIAVLIEWGAVYVLDRWRYAASMPILPGLGIGLSPVLQMLILPPVIFKLTAWWLDKRRRRT